MAWYEDGNGSDRFGKKPQEVDIVLKKVEGFFNDFKKSLPGLGVLIVVIVVGMIVYGGFYTVAPEEVGVVKRFGKAVRVTKPGPHFKVPFIETVLKPKVTTVHRLEVGFRTIDPGPPARYRRVAEEANMLTGDENIVSVEFIVQFKIKDPFDFLFNFRDKVNTIKDAAEASMREIVGKTLIDNVLTEGRFQVQQETKALLQKILDERYKAGIAVVAVQLQDVLPPEPVSDAFKDVASAREDKEKTIKQSEGFRNDLIPKAKGGAAKLINEAMAYKESTINNAKGDASRFLQVLAEYRKAKDVTRKRIYLETMEEILGKVDKIIIEGNAGGNLLPYLPLRRGGKIEKGGGK